jgi:hypothetical protein
MAVSDFGVSGDAMATKDFWKIKGYLTERLYEEYRDRYKECIRMLNGLEKTLEQKIPERERRWQVAEESAVYGADNERYPQDCPIREE